MTSTQSYFLLLSSLSLVLTGCMPQIPQGYKDHLERATRHTGMASTVELTQDTSPDTFRLRVEGNSLIPTIDVQRTFDEEMRKRCITDKPDKRPHILTQQTNVVNTWDGSVYEVVGTFRCDPPLPTEPEPLTPPEPPSSLPPFKVDLNPPPTKHHTSPPKHKGPHKHHHKRKSKTKSKGCNCATGTEPKSAPGKSAAPEKTPAAKPTPITPKPDHTT